MRATRSVLGQTWKYACVRCSAAARRFPLADLPATTLLMLSRRSHDGEAGSMRHTTGEEGGGKKRRRPAVPSVADPVPRKTKRTQRHRPRSASKGGRACLCAPPRALCAPPSFLPCPCSLFLCRRSAVLVSEPCRFAMEPSPPPAVARKTVLLRRKVSPSRPAPPNALQADAVRAMQEAAAARAIEAKQRSQAEAAQREMQQQQAWQQQQDMLFAQSQALSPASRKALVMRRMNSTDSLAGAAPVSPAAAAASTGTLSSLLPQSLALAAARGIGPGSPGWMGPPRDRHTGAVGSADVLGAPAAFEQAEQERRRQMGQQQQQDESWDNNENDAWEAKEQSQNGYASHAAPASRSSRLAQQLQAELAMARRYEAEEAEEKKRTLNAAGGLAFETKLLQGQEARILAAHARTQAAWGSFKTRVASQLGVPETQLNISRSDYFRSKVEEADLLDKARPADEKSAGREEQWAGSLRNTGSTFIQIGNMFSGLFTKVISNPKPKVEIIRRPTEKSMQTQRSLSQIAAPAAPAAASHHTKTWQHSAFLAERRRAQRKHISHMVRNQLVEAERAQIDQGLPADNAAILAGLCIQGKDMFELEELPEKEWYAQRMGGEQQDQDEQQDEQDAEAQARLERRRAKKAAALAAQQTPFDAPVSGPSLVASTARLFFPLTSGPTLTPSSHVEGDSLALISSLGAPGSLPGQDDRISRSVRLTNNGSTSIAFKFKKLEGVLEAEKMREGGSQDADGIAAVPSLSASDPSSFFFSANPSGTLLPGESTEVVFTFLPSAASRCAGTSTGQCSGVFLQRLELETEPRLPKGRHLTPWHLLQSAQRAASDDALEDSLPSLLLTGVCSSLDTASVDRHNLQEQLVNRKNARLAAQVLVKQATAVPVPAPEPELHREIFSSINRPLRLFYYAELMPSWHALARDVFDAQKRQLRNTLIWDYSAQTIQDWIHKVPARNQHRVAELQARYDDLVAQCAVRPAPHPVRYEACFGLVSSVVAAIPRMANSLQLQLGISEPLEADLRKAAEEKRRKADEEAKAKLPFHLRGGSANTVNLALLTPEQRKIREEEAARKAEAAAIQAAEDASKAAERATLTAQYNSTLEAQVRQQLSEALSYFDFLAAPQQTNLDPQALHPEEAAARAATASRQALAQGQGSLDVSVLQRLAPAPAAEAAVGSGKSSARPRSGGKKDVAPLKSSSSAASKAKGGASDGSATPSLALEALESPRLVSALLGMEGLSAEEQAQLAAAIASPHVFAPADLEALRARSLQSFLALERSRASTFDTRLVRSRVVYMGNGYSTPDTGVHIPTSAEIKLKEDRERMARYGQVVGKAEREAEERRQREMHPMARLAQRQVLKVAASSIFSMVYTRERGVYAWVAADAPDLSEEAALAAASAAALVADPKKKPSSATSKASALGTKTRLQEARRTILGFHLIPSAAGAASALANKKDDKSSSSSSSSKSKASPRGSGSGLTPSSTSRGGSESGKSNSNKKSSSASSSSSRPGSGNGGAPLSARSTSPTPAIPVASPPQGSLLPVMPTAQLPLGALCIAAGGSTPLPCFIPELQGLELVALSAGVHVAFLLTTTGALLAWEHATRRVQTILAASFPGQKELLQHQWSERAVRALMARDKAEGLDLTARPPSRGGNDGVVSLVRKSDKESARKAPPTAASEKATEKKSSRKIAPSASSSSSSNKKKVGVHEEAEVLAVDAAAGEIEAERVSRLARDSDLASASKQIVSVVVGGSGTLSAGVHYTGSTPPATDFEFVLLLSADGCVYSSLVTPPPSAHAAAAAAAAAAGDGSNKAAAAAAAAAAKSASKDSEKTKEKSTAMLGVGEKTKDALKAEKEASKAEVPVAQPLVHFELLQSLHPANLSAGLYASAGGAPVSEIKVVQISAGYGHASALCSDGSVWVWGNEGPQLGQGEKESKKPRFVPTLIPQMQQIVLPQLPSAVSPAVAAAASSAESKSQEAVSVAAASSSKSTVPPLKPGHARPGSSGGSSSGALSARKSGSAAPASGKKDPKQAAADLEADAALAGPLDPVVSVVCGAFHCLALTASGAVFAWGRGSEGQLGLGDLRDRDVPTLITLLSPSHNPALLVAALEKANAPPPPKAAAATRYGSAATAVAAPMSPRGASAATASPSSASLTPSPLSPFLRVVSLCAGGAHSLARAVPLPCASVRDEQTGTVTALASPSVLSWGSGAAGATGLGCVDDTQQPHTVPFFTGQSVLQLVAGGDCTEAVVSREASSAIALVADEDDLPNAVLIH